MSESLTVTVNGEEKKLFMSYGLLNKLAKMVGDANDVSDIYISPDLQAEVLKLALFGKGTPPDLDDIDISIGDSDKVINWVGEHTLNFFLRGLEAASALSKKNEARVLKLMPSSDGTETSPSETPAPGPTEPSPAA